MPNFEFPCKIYFLGKVYKKIYTYTYIFCIFLFTLLRYFIALYTYLSCVNQFYFDVID